MNGEYKGESDIGRLMHDFNCTRADDMNFELMAERTQYLKENPKARFGNPKEVLDNSVFTSDVKVKKQAKMNCKFKFVEL